ncbi:MAG: hypothetical protein K2Y21_13980 [Phycisphaerales bacterium]|nr:hypothetical protein [Phycisphaerales bacterium]
MAEEAKEAPKTEDKPAKGGLPIKTIGIVAVLMVVEAAAVFFVVGSSMKKPTEAKAHDLHSEEDAQLEALVELPLVEDKFQNMTGGTTWIWDASVFMKVKKRDEEKVNEMLQARQAEIKEGISLVFRRAQNGQLKEPGLETLNREITAFMNEIIEKAPDGTSRIQRILIPKCRGFPAG